MRKLLLCLMLVAAIALFAGCGKENSETPNNDNTAATQNNDTDKPVEKEDPDNAPNDEAPEIVGGDWRTWRSYTQDFQIKPDLTVCLSLLEDGSGYAVYDTKDGSRIGSLIADITGDELLFCADYEDDGIFELGLGGTPSGDIWFRYVDKPWIEGEGGGCFEVMDMDRDDVDIDDNTNTGSDTGNAFGEGLSAEESISYVDVVNTVFYGVYMEDTSNPDNSRYFEYENDEMSFETMYEFDCAFLYLLDTEDGSDSTICFLEKGMNNVMKWDVEDGGKLKISCGTDVYYGEFYWDPEGDNGNGALYCCVHIDQYNVWFVA